MAMPSSVTLINSGSNKIIPGTWYSQRKCGKKDWLVIKIENAGLIGGTQGTKIYKLIYTQISYNDGASGTPINSGATIGFDEVSVPANATGDDLKKAIAASAAKGAAFSKAKKALEEIATSKCDEDNKADGTLDNTPVPNTEINGVRWNPPPHFITRPPSFYDLANIGGGNASPRSAVNTYGKTANLKLGKIYQNKASAAALNAKAAANPNTVKADQLWGFKFLYNPKEISYGSTIDTAIDWMLQPKDPSNFFGGNTVITLNLYLNRIADMKALRSSGTIANDYPGGALTTEQKNGILKRGTEFDLEYLYRVVNGDPGNTSLVSDTSLLTSDFGYITGMPVWIQIHDNMRYRGSLSSIEVNHVIFTESMIPTLSVVKLSFIRYPELDKLGKNKSDIVDILTNKAQTTSS